MKLKSFGCSFIFGSELADVYYEGTTLVASKSTWPALLAQNLGYAYECYARPGSGNLQIAERVLSQAANPNISLFVIGWTWIDRFDYKNSTNDLPEDIRWKHWRTLLPSDNTPQATTYYKELHSEFRDKLTTLMSIRLVIDTLTQKGIPFIMTYMDDLMFDQEYNISPAVTELQEYIRPHMTTFDNLSFLEWSRKNGYPETAKWHPMEKSHLEASKYIIKEKLYETKNFDYGITRLG